MMQTPGKIIAAVPPTSLGSVIVERAAVLARAFGAQLRLVGCVYDPYVAGERFADSPDLKAAREALVEQRRTELDALAAEHGGDGLNISVQAVWAYPVYEGLVTACQDFAADLMVSGTFHHSALQRFGLTNTDWQLIRHAPCPLLLVRNDGFSGYHKVLAAVDPMHTHDKPADLDDRLLDAAELFAGTAAGEVHVLHCYLTGEYVPLTAPGAAVPALFYNRESPAEAHREAVEALARRHGLEPERIHIRAGDARQLIPDAAAELGVQLVVMGAVSRSRLKRLLIGSTAEAVLDSLRCDVLILKPGSDT